MFQRAVIMELGETANGLNITKEMILSSINTFSMKPIVFNDREVLKDYTNDEIVDKFNNENVIGLIRGGVEIVGNEVYAEILILDKYVDKWKGKYDNWCIQLNEDKTKFELISIECF